MRKIYKVAIVGATGLVGRTILKVLEEKNFTNVKYALFSSEKSAGQKIEFLGQNYIVCKLEENSFDQGFDFAIFSAGAEVAKKFAPIAVNKGTIVIDNSSFYRMNKDVPLVVPEVNPQKIFENNGIIANPNCSTIQAVLPIKALNDKYSIKRIVFSTYQAVSGAGKKGIDDLKSQVKDLQAQIKVTEKSIEQKEEEYNKQKELLDARVIALYKNGENSYLEIFLSSSSLKDFLSKYYYAEALMNADKEFMQKVTDEKKEIEATKAELEKNKSALDDALSQQRIKQNSLERLKNEKQTYVAQLTAEEKENQQEIEKFEEDKRKIQAELKRIAEEEAKKNTTNISQKPSASGYIFPVQGLSKSNINNKTYPSYKGHTGVDVNIGVSGKSVVAVKDGTVVISEARISNGKYYSYGEYIVISHGDGTMTLYAHMLANSRKVKVRDKVKQGQVIGTVGSTGNSTGTHLHFEVRVGGSPVNPLPYLP